jgi:hypothetical protein
MATETQNFNVNNFRAAIGAGGARPNQFEVIITYPSILPVTGNPGLQGAFLITTAELPGSTQGVAPVYYRGRLIKLAGDKEFAPFNMTIINDSAFTIRKALEDWMAAIEGRGTKSGLTSPASYMGTITVKQLERNGGVLRQYKIVDAFPVEVGPVQLDFGTNDQISTFGATFQYQTFEILPQPANIVAPILSDVINNNSITS